MLRRDALLGLAALAASPAAAGLVPGPPRPFSLPDLIEETRAMARRRYRPAPEVPEGWRNLSYDQFRRIWFDHRNAVWEGTDTPLRLDLFPAGLYFPRPVQISIVENGTARTLPFTFDVFDRTDDFPDLPEEGMGYSGLRLRGPIERPGIHTEFAVFQGASYFRAIGTGQVYGLSARGLALETAEPEGEEFPDFRAFWVEPPASGAMTTVLHAQLDGPSVTGIYSFEITPGPVLRMGVTARLFPRRLLRHVGLGPLTSMFQFDETNRDRFSDFRPAVHDSDGLLMANGAGERIWRPLANPRTLQISAFRDTDPVGFGLMQRADRYSDFHDLEALYHMRPGLWVRPRGVWGPGHVTLVEIPTEREVYDNIVAYWRPDAALGPGDDPVYAYDLYWGREATPGAADLPRVLNTRSGARDAGGIIFAIDFAPGPGLTGDLGAVERLVRTSAGRVSEGVLQRNPETGGPRLAFTFHPEGTDLAEFRAQLTGPGGPLSEVWLYRWTP